MDKAMTASKYPAELVEKVARAIAIQCGRDPDEVVKSATPSTIYHLGIKGRTAGEAWHYSEHAAWSEFKLGALAALDATPYAAMRAALEEMDTALAFYYDSPESERVMSRIAVAWEKIRALRAADGDTK